MISLLFIVLICDFKSLKMLEFKYFKGIFNKSVNICYLMPKLSTFQLPDFYFSMDDKNLIFGHFIGE